MKTLCGRRHTGHNLVFKHLSLANITNIYLSGTIDATAGKGIGGEFLILTLMCVGSSFNFLKIFFTVERGDAEDNNLAPT